MLQDACLLIGLIALVYLGDSALLLHRNEGVVVATRRAKWAVGLGSRDFELAGKYLFIPNPLFPHRSLFRLSWEFEGPFAPTAEDWESLRNATQALVPYIWAMATALFVLLPLGFLTRLGDPALIAALVLLYSSIVAALVWTWRNRLTFDLNRAQFATLAFECLVCSPLALNLTRKLSMRLPLREDLVSASRRLQKDNEWQATRAKLLARLDAAIEIEEEGSPRMAALMDHRRRVMER